MPRHREATLLLLSVVAVFATTQASAAPAWVSRGIIIPRGDVALGLGLGFGRAPTGPNTSMSGFGLNLEIAVGTSSNVELGVRAGFRLDDGGQGTQADGYGRAFQSETYGTRFDRVSNPEVRVRWVASRTSVAELGTELRAYVPTEAGSRFGSCWGFQWCCGAGRCESIPGSMCR